MAKIDALEFAKISVPADQPRKAARHSKVMAVGDDIYMVRGRMKSTKARPWFERMFLYYSRTMTVIRRSDGKGGHDLTLINTIRLSERGLAQLQKLGRIAHVVRLGSFHGVDDTFYLDRFDAQYWVVADMEHAPGFAGDFQTMSSGHLPIADAQYFAFENIKYPEAVIILPATENRAATAITTDSIQNHTGAWDIDNSLLVSLAIRKIGLIGEARLGPIWMRDQVEYTGEALTDGAAKRAQMIACLRPQYEALIAEFDFDMLMPGHGWPIYSDARQAIAKSIDDQLTLG
ncbi:MAG: hypothetical protein ABJK59_09530 [Erythrobacter sp.]|uniref:hypothetical protein n=1 Tax=Erythrobacter sp. TaxID=1042 RepID=UPI0032992450